MIREEDVFPVAGFNNSIKAIKTKEFRAPKKGEFYISGAIPMAYKAYEDLDDSYRIAKIVKVKKVVTYELIETS